MKIVIVGATGCVGQMVLSILEQKGYPKDSIELIASSRSSGKKIPYQGSLLTVKSLFGFDFSSCDVALSAAGADVSKQYVPDATQKGCFVIDKTSCFRMENDVPLVIPEINARDILNAKRKIISSPNCSTTPLALSLFPIMKKTSIEHVVVSTYQAVSGLGCRGLQTLEDEILNQHTQLSPFPKSIAYNVIPHIDHFLIDGSTKEEWKMKVELNKILKSNIQTSVTCVRVPVRMGHAMSVYMRTQNSLTLDDIYDLWSNQKGLKVCDDPKCNLYTTPKEHSGDDLIYVSRLRKESPKEFLFWTMGDNLRKGAALNAIQILEELERQKLISVRHSV